MQKKIHEMFSNADLSNPRAFMDQPKDMEPKWTALLKKPRVIKGKSLPPMAHEGFQVRLPELTEVGLETFVCFFEEFPPGGSSQRHGHMNEAVFYILEGRGYEIHDDEKFPWEAGDIVIVPAGSVHRHVNADPDNPAKALVINPKPTYISYNLKAQRLVDRPGEGSV
ncbi:MAG: cupin domain-containing protein [Dehalococcoidia bacterium]|nr:cupin domain-containing protein [Dehalococcoidia bacterium]